MGNNERSNENVFANGDLYVGNFKGLLPHGEGKYTWSDGKVYKGEWEEGKMTGKGRIYWTSGANYDGDFSSGYFHGFGIFSGTDGSVYKGTWRMNRQDGMGRKQYFNSDIYEGFWKEGVKEGNGSYVWCNGDTFTGNWKAGKMCGRGIMEWLNGDLFDGFWLDGLRHGSGFYKLIDGGYYFGTWSRGLKDGQGAFYPAGSKLPPMPNWYSSIRYNDHQQIALSHSSSLNIKKSRKNNFGRSLSEKLSVRRLLRNSGRILNRSISLEWDWCLHDPMKEVPSREGSEEGRDVVRDNYSNLVYIREYMQGVLTKEKVRSDAMALSSKKTWNIKFRGKETKSKRGEIIFKGRKSYYLMLNLQTGIRYTVGKITPVPMREVRCSDFGPRARIRMCFPKNGSQFTPSHNSIGFSWKDYCPMVFRNLREMFKIDAADHMMSICGGDGLKEVSSPGKSGSLFYLSQDERFVIKTLRKSELKVLLRMLPNYYNHVQTYENTLITKFFGLHRITLRGGKKVRFVVMGNMFCTELRIHRRFDLKGSSQGRITCKDQISENTTLKDLDLSHVFHMDQSWREALFE
ncbi:hypothetical protein GIB67_000797 [Kingdonia uniflora]|uniref:1-phosphatidylinositol-4-phosphate 5-kinase n=1 Tax=Kingdonia uniflora TaxID=39325 RepID=A0A7J7NZX4_9MAGN|nr:hypothetical protein GIB67_000797 [Kingdonia uniflora]